VTDKSTLIKEGRPRRVPLFPSEYRVPFLLVTALFFLWGIPNNLNDVLIRQFMKSFAISRFQAGLIQSAFYLGYFLLAMPAAMLMRRLGYKAGFATGLLLFGAGALLFWPAAIVGRYDFFLFALFVIASGLSFLETASNPFIAQLGDPESSERRLNLSQAFNPLGSITGTLIGTVFIFSGIELRPQQIEAMKTQHLYDAYLRSETMRVVKPYLALGAVAIFWALLILRTNFSRIQVDHEAGGDPGRFRELFRHPHFWMAVAAQFLYVGAQVGTWSYFIQYVQEFTHEPEKIAGYFLTGTLAAFGMGRFSSAWLMRYVAPNAMLGTYAIVNVIRNSAPGLGGSVGHFRNEFFHVPDVPYDFCSGTERPGRKHQNWRIVDRNGDCGGCSADSSYGIHCGGAAQYSASLHRPAVRISLCWRIRVRHEEVRGTEALATRLKD
jgi:MFS transporter, FHS family, L-fucose permease